MHLSLLMGDRAYADAMRSGASRLQTHHPKAVLFITGVFNHLFFLLSAIFRCAIPTRCFYNNRPWIPSHIKALLNEENNNNNKKTFFVSRNAKGWKIKREVKRRPQGRQWVWKSLAIMR